MKLSVKPNAEKIVEISDKFLGVFFLLAKEESFLDCLLGLHYASRNVFNFSQTIYSKEEMEKTISEIYFAADKNTEYNLKQIGGLIKELEKNNWEEIDDTNK